MSDEQEVTLGEVYRAVLRVEEQGKITNGRVTALEKDAIRIKVIWTAGTIGLAAAWQWFTGKQ